MNNKPADGLKQALREAAEKIESRTWEAEGSQVFSVSNGTADALVLEVFGDETSGQQDCDIAHFIAAANPATVIMLLDEIEMLSKSEWNLAGELADAQQKIALKCKCCKSV